jgi:hypothetical protein
MAKEFTVDIKVEGIKEFMHQHHDVIQSIAETFKQIVATRNLQEFDTFIRVFAGIAETAKQAMSDIEELDGTDDTVH